MAKWGGVNIPQIEGNDAIFQQGMRQKADALQQAAKMKQDMESAEKEDALRRFLSGSQDEAAMKRQMAEQAFKASEAAKDRALKERELSLSNLIKGPTLTPAQEAAEKDVGKQIAAFEAGGGKAAFEKNIGALEDVKSQLESGKRDWYDRLVGGATAFAGPIMGLLAPAEKARRDQARNTAITLAKQTDPNPTEKQIETIMGQIYDPASPDEANKERIDRYLNELRAKQGAISKAAGQYQQTGYGTMGAAPSATPAPDARMQRLQELRAKAGKR